MIEYPQNIQKRIKKIVKEFGLYNKKNDEENTIKKIFNEPVVVIAEMLAKYKKGEIKEEEMSSFLENNLQITTNRAIKVKERISEDIISDSKQVNGKKSTSDRYREPIE